MYSDGWAFFAAKYGRDYTLDPFKWQWTTAALGAAAQAQFTINMSADCWNAIVGIRHMASIAFVAGAIGSGEFTLQLSYESRDMQNGAINGMLWGTPIYIDPTADFSVSAPGITLPYPKFIPPGGVLTGVIVNGTVANNIIRIVFDTVKMFKKRPDAEAPTPISDRAKAIGRKIQEETLNEIRELNRRLSK